MKFASLVFRLGRGRLVFSAVVGLAAGAAMAALMRQVHETLTQPQPDVGRAAGQFLLLVVAYALGTLAADQAMNRVSEEFQADLRVRLMRHFLRQPLRLLERLGAARMHNLLVQDVRTISDFVCRLPEAFIDFAVAAGCFVYMAWLSPVAFGFNVVFVGLAALCYIIPDRGAQRALRQAGHTWDRHTGQIQYGLQGLKLLLPSPARRDDYVDGHLARTAAEYSRLQTRGRFLHLVAERLGEGLMLVNVGCLLFVLPRFTTLTPALATGLLLAAVFARAPLKDLLGALSRARRARVALERLQETGLAVEAAVRPEPVTAAAAPAFARLEFENVTFRYEGDHDQAGFAVGPFSFAVNAGEMIFIVGGNGMGKTTLAKLITGLYPPAGGTIRLNGEVVETAAARARLQACCAATYTEDPLFEHILGLPPAEAEARGRTWLQRLRLAEKVSLAGTAFSTTDLSQGQRRRLMLLSALIDGRPLLVLDEWAADQDPAFRTFFYEELVPAWRAEGRTLLLITHDDRYFARADRLLKLENGRLVPAAVPQADGGTGGRP